MQANISRLAPLALAKPRNEKFVSAKPRKRVLPPKRPQLENWPEDFPLELLRKPWWAIPGIAWYCTAFHEGPKYRRKPLWRWRRLERLLYYMWKEAFETDPALAPAMVDSIRDISEYDGHLCIRWHCPDMLEAFRPVVKFAWGVLDTYEWGTSKAIVQSAPGVMVMDYFSEKDVKAFSAAGRG